MALHDLTPQLRTRLSRMERAVGWFVALALSLLTFGFAYYVYTTAERKGWFLTKAPYFTYVKTATGLRVGDPVMLMGFEAGRITRILPERADQFVYNVFIEFELKSPNYGYIWTEGSEARIATADFLGKRVVEVTKGIGGYPTFHSWPIRTVTIEDAARLGPPGDWRFGQEIEEPNGTNLLARPLDPISRLPEIAQVGIRTLVVVDVSQERKALTAMWNYKTGAYDPYTNNVSSYWLLVDETPAVTERLQALVGQIEEALPGVLAVTNQLTQVLTNTATLSSNLNLVALGAIPAVSNLAVLTAQLDHAGALGEWLLPTNINRQLEGTLAGANSALVSANTNLSLLSSNLLRTLDNIADITSNLNDQVQANTNILSGISDAVVHTDELVQGLKRHWLLRSAFKEKKPKDTNAPPSASRLRSPKEKAR
jgi:hypothetical protein